MASVDTTIQLIRTTGRNAEGQPQEACSPALAKSPWDFDRELQYGPGSSMGDVIPTGTPGGVGYYREPKVLLTHGTRVEVEIDGIGALEREQFGPILHIVRYKADEIDRVIETINAKQYGLTFGVHSRNESFAKTIAQRIRVGNVYVNRNIIGAVVGVQPFGGQGLSGTGPKAGGPNYLLRFATEKALTINTAALGGNASLLALGDE